VGEFSIQWFLAGVAVGAVIVAMLGRIRPPK
jgi:hypothetical protein